MDTLILAFIILGTAIMLYDIIRYIIFLKSTNDVLSYGGKSDKIWRAAGLVLLIFFFLAYLFVAIFAERNIVVALILFFGSIFISIMLILMFKLLETVKTRSLDIAKVLISVIDARDPNLNGHSLHVQRLTMLIYKYMPRYMRAEINPISLEYASLMHDVGKLGIPEAILNKPAKLTDEEWEIMRTHPKIGVKLLQPLKAFDDIDSWICYHHERIDGNGYYKIPEKEIPLASKIISVADTYSAITMRRSYKAPKTHDEAVRIIKEVTGTQLDAQIVNVFLSIPREEVEKCMPEEVKY